MNKIVVSNLFAIIISVVAIVAFGAALVYFGNHPSTPTADGRLPKDFSWAYGKWRVTYSDSTPTFSYDFEVIIGNDSIQFLRDFRKDEYLFPYVECAKKIEYDVFFGNPEAEELEPHNYAVASPTDEIAITYSRGEYGDTYLFLNRKRKTISLFSLDDLEGKSTPTTSKRRIKNKYYQAFEKAAQSCPLIGDWKNEDRGKRRDKMTFTYDDIINDFRPLKTDAWTNGYDVYSYDAENDCLSKVYVGNDGEKPETYRRYDAEQERLEEQREREMAIKSSLTRKFYSCMTNNVYSNSSYLHQYSFESDGTGTVSFYEVELYGKTLLSRRNIEWKLIDEKTLHVYDSEATSGYDIFTIDKSYMGVSIKDMAGHVYN